MVHRSSIVWALSTEVVQYIGEAECIVFRFGHPAEVTFTTRRVVHVWSNQANSGRGSSNINKKHMLTGTWKGRFLEIRDYLKLGILVDIDRLAEEHVSVLYDSMQLSIYVSLYAF